MFSLLYGFWQYIFQRDEYYILILGLDNAGKTTLLEQAKIGLNPGYKGVNLLKISCTVGLNIGKIQSQGVVLNFWDLGGQSELQCLWDKYYSESHGIVYVIDSSDAERIEDSRLAFEKMINNEALRGIPLLFVVNKQDVQGSLSLNQIKEIFNFTQLQQTNKRDYHFAGVSALQGDGIKDCILWITESVIRNNEDRPPIVSQE
ncbi:ADP-ribosylation factor protein 1 [Blomia tropicalis]|nr:ADP-ribosylation factor protein 1 [Blomia tropicalis]